MSFKEVNALRKAGRLDEAIAMAQADLDREQSSWSISAMFWCLNDRSKREEGEQLKATADQMLQLVQALGEPDEIVAAAVKRLELRLDPHCAVIQRALADSKEEHRAIDACATLTALYNEGQLGPQWHEQYGWTLYRALHADQSADTLRRRRWLHVYLKLGLERPSLLHSLILSEAVRIERAMPQDFLFSGFVTMWGLENLREDDWKDYVTADGLRVPSLVEKVIAVYVKEMLVTPRLVPGDAFNDVLDRALEMFKSNENLPRYKAQLLICDNRTDEAIDFYRKMIVKSPSKFFLWSELSELVDEQELKISMLCCALNSHVKDEFVGKLRLKLARLLCEAGQQSQARHEVDRFRETYDRNRWKIPTEYYVLYSSLQQVESSGNNRFYKDNCALAQDFVYGSLPSTLMVKVGEKKDVNKAGKPLVKWVLMSENCKYVLVVPRKFNLRPGIPAGTAFDVTLQDKRPVKVCESKGANLAWVKRVRGYIHLKTSRDDKPFGIVEGFYIPAFMLKGLNDKDLVDIVSVKEGDRWKCVYCKVAEVK
ncbi:MAG: hypothetical protein MJZ74_09630 [Muribaculaceae bacterium]|nr:hypothetical protein [Muribaculaceae bacterium]